jgi:phosphonoacetaldehyde dehydrogenase
MHEFGSIAGGQQHTSGDWLAVNNPYTGIQVGRVAMADADAIEAILQQTRRTRINLSRYQRQEILLKMAAAVRQNADEISRMITDESGLCLQDTRYEASRVADVLHFSAVKSLDDDSEVYPCDITPNGRPRRIYTMRQPLNLIAAITPFNHPMNQVAHKIAPAIATNNTVVLKPSEKTPLSAYYLAQLALDCGLPPDMLNVVNGPTRPTSELLVRHRDIELVSFTGSSAVGRQIAAAAGYKRLVLELGGSSALLVLEDAKIEAAAAIAAAGIFKNSGQRCTAIRRLLVHHSLADDFGQCLAAKAASLRCGDPYDASNDMGTVITAEAAAAMEARVEKSIAAGAHLLAGHHRQGACYSPTVLDRVENDHELVACETFGPIAPILRFDTLDQAIAIANDTPYGLSGGVVSDHWPSIQRVITELEVGTVNVNEAPSYRLEWTPFGGIKDSGLGYKEGVIETMKAMTNLKTYSLPWDTP